MASGLPTTPSNARPQPEQDRIKVAVRMRPANPKEVIRRGDQVVIECRDDIGEILVQDRFQSKKYSFDTVFGPGASQKTVFNVAVTPTLDEVLKGYSCTIFAYGQTGTGKTFTMEGDRSDDRALGWEDDPVAGIIPRTVAYFYDRLKSSDYSIRVSYMEIYNENLTDLLSARDGTAEVPLKICVNTSGSACVQNLTEHMVRTKDEIFELLQRGSLKRRTAETKMNERSSRSHAVFMITLVMQQKSDIGEEVVKTGKLYLVDLAGSENISRSGAQEGRAQEAGNINKSLLTLGRVITALVERKPHIPYRDSKLTRLLQDSLGGRNKTTIIATLSPALNSLDETLSTLDYAFKAKNILNKPEINQRVSKDTHVKEIYAELEKAKRDLEATWAKAGITLSKETYQNMQEMLDARREKIQSLEVEVQQFQSLFTEHKSIADGLRGELRGIQDQFRILSKRLEDCRKELIDREVKVAGWEFVASEIRQADDVNVSKFIKTIDVADETISQLSTLHNRIEVRSQIEKENEDGFKKVTTQIDEAARETREKIRNTTARHGTENDELRSSISSSFDESCKKLGSIGEYFKTVISQTDHLKKWGDELLIKLQYGEETDKAMASVVEHFQTMLSSSRDEYVNFVSKITSLTREAKEEAESNRDLACGIFKTNEQKVIAFSEQLKEKVESSVSSSISKVELAAEQARKIGEAAKAISEMIAALQTSFVSLTADQESIRRTHEDMGKEAVVIAGETKEQSAKIVSQLVDSFYRKVYEINEEVKDQVECRQKEISDNCQSEITKAVSDSKSRASEMDACLASENASAQTILSGVEGIAQKGCEIAGGLSEETVSFSKFIDEKLKLGSNFVHESLVRIDEEVDQVAKLPTQFLSQHLRVYQPSGTTPKPQSWYLDREPVIVPSNERILSAFKPPSELIAAAEAMEKADAEIVNQTKLPDTLNVPLPSIRRSNSVENICVVDGVPSLARQNTMEVPLQKEISGINLKTRRALGTKAPTQQQSDE